MTAFLTILANPFVIQLALSLLSFVINKSQDNKEMIRVFDELTTLLREKGIANAKTRYESEKQIKAGDDFWDKVEENEKKK